MKLQSIYSYFANHPEADWIIDWPKARLLYNYVKEHPVKKILDLGTGIGATAAIFALAMKNKGEENYEIHTVEQFQKCYDLAQKLIPDELKEHTKFYLASPIVWNEERIPYQYFSIFEKLPDFEPDLILVDGPGPWADEEGHYIDLPNGDVMKMLLEGKLKKGQLIAWDGRIQAGKLLERFFSENFYLAFSGEGTNFRILEVKDPEAKFLDDMFEGIKMGSNYFKEASNVGPPSLRVQNPWDLPRG